MSTFEDDDSTEYVVRALSHLAFCALVALAFARQDGIASTPWSENLFLTRWLATAQKQKRFPRCVAADIGSLLERGRHMGPTAGLPLKLDYLWRSCTGDIAAQSDLFRLTYATEKLRDQGWDSQLLKTKEWASAAVPPEVRKHGFWVDKATLNAAFDRKGCLQTPFPFRVSGDVRTFIDTLAEYGLKARVTDKTPLFDTIMLERPVGI